MRTAELDPAVFAYMTRIIDADRENGYYDALVIVLQPELAPEGILEFGQYWDLCSEPISPTPEHVVIRRIPIKSAVDGGLRRMPYELLLQSAMVGILIPDIGYSLSDELPPPPPLIFDAGEVPDGVYWIATENGFSPVRIWHPLAPG